MRTMTGGMEGAGWKYTRCMVQLVAECVRDASHTFSYCHPKDYSRDSCLPAVQSISKRIVYSACGSIATSVCWLIDSSICRV
jgi:hypothetical protein